MFESLILHLSLLTDPPENRHQANLTLKSLVDVLDDTEAELKSKLQAALDKIQDACVFARRLRNKRIAHRDRCVSALPSATVKDLENAVMAVRDFMDCVEAYYDLPRSVFATDLWGAKSLVRFLQIAVAAQEEEQRRFRELVKADLQQG